MSALFINAAILIVAAGVFHGTGYDRIADIGDAYKTLTPLLGTAAASTLFAVALLLSGQNSTLTGTLAGQIVMEGFLSIRLRPWLRRLVTRLIAIIPAIVVLVIYGDSGTGPLLLLSQVILSLQLPFAVFPLIMFTGDRRRWASSWRPFWMRAIAGRSRSSSPGSTAGCSAMMTGGIGPRCIPISSFRRSLSAGDR